MYSWLLCNKALKGLYTLNKRELKVRINNKFSRQVAPHQGLPQGSPLSPHLYNVYCHDIYNDPHTDPIIFNPNNYILQFADDTALVAHSSNIEATVNNLQHLMAQTEIWFNKWRLKTNPNKSQFIIFNHNPDERFPKVNINNYEIKAQTIIKYLGVHFDQKLNFNHHTKVTKKKCQTRAKHFRALTYRNKGINTKTAAHIYISICRPLLEYAHPIYINCRPPAIKNLQTAETTALRSITRMRHHRNQLHNPPNSLLYERTQITPIPDRINALTNKLTSRTDYADTIEPLCIKRPENHHSKYKFPTKTILEEITKLREDHIT